MAIDIRGLVPLLQVFDIQTSIRFYREMLGFELAGASREPLSWALLRRDAMELMLNGACEDDARPAAPDPVRIAMHAGTALFFACPDVDGAFRHLRARGLDVKEPVVRDYGMKQLYLLDPDGYNLCFQWSVSPETVAGWRESNGVDAGCAQGGPAAEDAPAR